MPHMSNMPQRPSLSIVLPTWNAAAYLEATLAGLRDSGLGIAYEVIVADGGSTDGTVAIAQRFGAKIVTPPAGTQTAGTPPTGTPPAGTPPGRGHQLRAGAEVARGQWLFFLHGDSVPSRQWAGAVAAFLDAPENAGLAAACRFALASEAPAARRLEKIVALRCRLLGLPYGDQGLLISRALYDAMGGFASLPIMEDVEFVRRLGRARLRMLDAPLTTSAERYERGGYWRRSLRNFLCLTLYFLGVSSGPLRRLYG